MNYFLLIMIVIILLLAFSIYYVITYNKLQHYQVRTEVAENTIDEFLRTKYDLLCELNIDIKNATNNKDYLKEYIEYKNKRITNYDTDRKLTEAFVLVKEIMNDHKKLQNKDFANKYDNLKEIDEELSASRNYFNKNITELNNIIRKFPTNLIARRHKFRIKPYFDNKNMQDRVLDDFKL